MSSSNSSLHDGSQSSRRSLYKSTKQRKQALRTVLTRTQTLQQDDDVHALMVLRDLFKEADDIHEDASLDEKVGHQDQVVMDSEVMNVSSNVIRACTHSLTQQCSAFSKTEFTGKLLNFVENLPDATLKEPNWSLLEYELPFFKTTAQYTCLSDWMSLSEQPVNVKSKKERKPASQRQAQAPLKRPENVVQLEEEEKAIEKTVQRIAKLINRLYKTKSEPIDFFELILDPRDFGKTVENLFHVSFLARDGRIQLSTDDDGIIVITPCSADMQNRALELGENGKFQNILSLDMEQWRLLNDTYQLSEPMINF